LPPGSARLRGTALRGVVGTSGVHVRTLGPPKTRDAWPAGDRPGISAAGCRARLGGRCHPGGEVRSAVTAHNGSNEQPAGRGADRRVRRRWQARAYRGPGRASGSGPVRVGEQVLVHTVRRGAAGGVHGDAVKGEAASIDAGALGEAEPAETAAAAGAGGVGQIERGGHGQVSACMRASLSRAAARSAATTAGSRRGDDSSLPGEHPDAFTEVPPRGVISTDGQPQGPAGRHK